MFMNTPKTLRVHIKIRTPRSLALIPTLLPRGEGLETCSPRVEREKALKTPLQQGEGEVVRAGFRLAPGHFVRRSRGCCGRNPPGTSPRSRARRSFRSR